MARIVGVLAFVVIAGFAVFGGIGGTTAALLVALLAGVIAVLSRTRRSRQ